jgi:hypothetical protein
VKNFVTENLNEWIVEKTPGKMPVRLEIEPQERIARVEEELKNQRELMRQGFASMKKRFEQSDRRFESLTQQLDRCMIWSFGITFTVLIISAIKRW